MDLDGYKISIESPTILIGSNQTNTYFSLEHRYILQEMSSWKGNQKETHRYGDDEDRNTFTSAGRLLDTHALLYEVFVYVRLSRCCGKTNRSTIDMHFETILMSFEPIEMDCQQIYSGRISWVSNGYIATHTHSKTNTRTHTRHNSHFMYTTQTKS